MNENELRARLNDLCRRTPAGIAGWSPSKVQRYKQALKGAMSLLSRYHANPTTLRYTIIELSQFHNPEEPKP